MSRRKNPIAPDRGLQQKIVKALKPDLSDPDFLLELSDRALWGKDGIKNWITETVIVDPSDEVVEIFSKWIESQIDWDRVWREAEIADIWEARG